MFYSHVQIEKILRFRDSDIEAENDTKAVGGVVIAAAAVVVNKTELSRVGRLRGT